jgi:hypothetical protein
MLRNLSLIFLMTSLVLQGCGRRDPVLDVGEFAPYVADFEKTGAKVGVSVKVEDLIIKFGDLPNPRERGACEIVGDKTPTITVSKAKWAKLDEYERQQLLFHEMGHCVLMQEHRNCIDKVEGVAKSMMNAYAIDSYTYAEREKYYLTELFTRAAQNDPDCTKM